MREVAGRVFADPIAKLASLVLAVLAWLYVQSDQIHESRITAAVQWKLPPERTATEPLPETVMLLIRGTYAATRRAEDAGVQLAVDASALGLGKQTIDLGNATAVGLPPGIELVGPQPRDLSLVLDERATRKVKVDPVQVGDPAAGWLVDGIDLDPAVVQISGPRSVVGSLRAISTQPIDVSGLSADAIVPADLDLPRTVELLAGEAKPTAHVHVRPAVERVTFPTVPVYVWRHPDWRSEVATVEVILEGPANALEDVRPEQVVGFVHLPDAPARADYEASFGPDEGVRLRILHPAEEEIHVVKVEPPRVKVVAP